ncbi:uncharacterized protein SOCE26_014060 [Sorangium cellulosum]|uniref:Uncharacterized protein n=1 Tax=Sorangium cellulosum TaxID=56 RepID=A0A2L0EL33_SORCE|nr:hypothetical protein [Sorangium cellulosum]AUX40011.1 uncharacterized protein SOCE26_014060 [Sorangium cellulosum]
MTGCAAACGAPGPQAVGGGPAERPAEGALRPSGAAPIELGQIVNRARARFRSTPRGLSAEGAAHRIDLEGGAARILARSSATAAPRGEREEQVEALLEARTAAEFEARRRALRRTLLERTSGELPPGGALTLTTRSIARAGYECVNGEGHVRIAADGGAERAFETCSELWKNHEANAEQAFRFPERPGGHGDLVVRVSARLGAADAAPSIASVASDARGLVLGAASGQRFVYGHGTWIDASGRRVPVPARWADGHIELRVPAAVVEESGYPAVLDPEVGPEIGTEPPVPVQLDVGFDPEIATDGASYVVAFEDLSRIRAVRVDASGNVLDFDWLDLGEEGVGQFLPSVAYGGGRYLFTWCHSHDSQITIHGRMMRPDGTLEGSASFAIPSSGGGLFPSVEWNGERFVASWLSLTGDGVEDVHVTLIDPSGSVVPGAERAVSTSGQASRPVITSGADVSVVAWDDASGDVRAVRAARVAGDGTVLDVGGVQISEGPANARLPALASSGASFLATWVRDDWSGAIRGAVLRADGTITAVDFPISRSSPDTQAPTAAFDGSSYLVAWADERDRRSMYGTRVSVEGVVQGTDDTRLADGPLRSVWDSDRNSLVWNGSHFLLAFHGQGIEGSLIGPDLALDAGRIVLSPMPNKQWSPRVVWTGESYLVAWTHQPGPDPLPEQMSGRAVRVSAAGEALDAVGTELVSGGSLVDLASSGEGTSVLTWRDPSGGDYLRPIASDGTPGDVVAVSSRYLSSSAGIESNGDGYLVTFVERSTEEPYVYTASGRLLDAAGNAGPVFPIVPPAESSSSVYPLPAGQDYLVVHRNRDVGVRLVPVSRTGEVGESFFLADPPVSVSAATNGTDTLVVWTKGEQWPRPADGLIHGRIYADGGWRGEAFVISTTGAGYSAAVAWGGTSYQVVWEEAETHRLQLRAVAPDGTLGPEALLVDGECSAPSLARGEHGRLLLAYEKPRHGGYTRRVVSRLLTLEPSSGTGAGGSGGAEAGAGGSGGAEAGAGGSGGAAPGTGGSGGAEAGAGGGSGGAAPGTGGGGAEAGAGGSGGAEAGAGGSGGAAPGGDSSSASASSGGNDGTDDTSDDSQCSFRGGADRPGHLGLAVSLFGLALVARRRGPGSAQDARSRAFRR